MTLVLIVLAVWVVVSVPVAFGCAAVIARRDRQRPRTRTVRRTPARPCGGARTRRIRH